jgi:RHS repeat-associated protein
MKAAWGAILLSCALLMGQSFQSSFSSPRYDRIKSPSLSKGLLEVDTATGAALVHLPLGPGIGARGADFRPLLQGRHAAYRTSFSTGDAEGARGWFGFAPGSLTYSGGYLLGRYEGPKGESERFGIPSARVAIFDTRKTLDAFGYTQSVTAFGPTLDPTLDPGLSVTDDGALILPIMDKALPSLTVTSPALQGYSSNTYQLPHKVLVIRGDTAYEFGYVNHSWIHLTDSAGSSPTDSYVEERFSVELATLEIPCPGAKPVQAFHTVSSTIMTAFNPGDTSYGGRCGLLSGPELNEVHYTLTRISNRFGESVRLNYGNNSNGFDYVAEWYRGETPTGIRIKQQLIAVTGSGGLLDTHFQVRISYEGISHTSYLVALDQVQPLAGLRGADWWAARGSCIVASRGVTPPAGRGGLVAPMQYSRITRLVPESSPAESVAFCWEQIGNSSLDTRLQKISSPGREITLGWEPYEYRENLIGDLMGFHSPAASWDLVRTFSYGINRLEDRDLGSGVVQTTLFSRAVPIPDWSRDNAWLSQDSTATVTHPGGEITFYRYMGAPTYDEHTEGGLLGSPYSIPEQQMKTLAWLKNSTVEERHYSPGGDWSADIGRSPDQSLANRIVLNDRFTLRSPGNPNGTYGISSRPFPTRTRIVDRLNQTVAQQEKVCWDPTERGWRQLRHLTYGTLPPMNIEVLSLADTGQAPDDAPATVQRQTDLHHQSDVSLWLLGRETDRLQSTLIDNTGSLAAGTVLPFQVGREIRTIDALNRVTEIQYGPSSALKVTSTYPSSGPEQPLLKSISLTGPFAQSSAVGASYDYEPAFGFLKTIHPATENSALVLQQKTDGAGRTLSLTGMDGLVTGFQWDPLGRLLGTTPPGNELGTTYAADSDGLGLIIQRGAEKSQVRLNAFGNLVLERRWDAAGTPTHRAFGYDDAGRKIWETVWRSGPGDEHGWHEALGPDDRPTPAWTEITNECIGWSNFRISPRVCVLYRTIDHPTGFNCMNSSTHYKYDSQGRLVLVLDPNGSAVQTVYGVRSRTVTAGLTWDGAQVLTTAATAMTTFNGDAEGRLQQVVDPLSQCTNYFYDGAGRSAEVAQYSASQTQVQRRYWKYNSLGWLVLLDQPESGVTYYTSFNVQGKPTETVYGLPSGWRPSSWEARDASAFGVANIRAVGTTYDSMGRSKRVRATDGSVDDNSYFGWPGGTEPTQSFGKLTKATTVKGAERALEYDPGTGRISKLTRKLDGYSFPMTLAYDAAYGRLTQRGYPDGRVQVLSNDPATGLPSSTRFGPFGATSPLAGMDYHPVNWALINLSFPLSGAITTLTYDADQTCLATMRHVIPGGLLDQTWSYSYDAAGRLSSDSEDWYAYDALGRLTRAVVRGPARSPASEGFQQSFTYDAFGNRTELDTKKLTAWNPGTIPTGAMTTVDTATGLSFKMSGSEASALGTNNRLPGTIGGLLTGATYDAQGNLKTLFNTPGSSAPQLISLTYDALARVTSLGDSKNATAQAYTFDDQGLRIKVVDSRTGLTTYNLYNEARQLLATYTKTATGALTWKKDVVYLGTKEIAEVDAAGTEVTLVDHLGSPRFAWRGGSSTVIRQKFLPFGEALTAPSDTASFAKGFTNHEQTDPSGLIYMQARFYLPMWGRFASPDPARDQHFEETQSWNIYSYVQNNPVMSIDPTGMWKGDVHTRMTRILAYALGASWDKAQKIGNATQRVDGNPKTDAYAGKDAREKYHFTDEARRTDMKKEYTDAKTDDMKSEKFGDYLHAVQDNTNSKHASWRAAIGHISGADDLTQNRPDEAMNAATATIGALKEFLGKDGMKGIDTDKLLNSKEFSAFINSQKEDKGLEEQNLKKYIEAERKQAEGK